MVKYRTKSDTTHAEPEVTSAKMINAGYFQIEIKLFDFTSALVFMFHSVLNELYRVVNCEIFNF